MDATVKRNVTTAADDAAARSAVAPQNFYEGPAMAEADRIELRRAQSIEGLTDEIALLRAELKKAVQANPAEFKLLMNGVATLVKAVATQYRLSPKARRDLAANITTLLNQLGDQLLPRDR